MDDFNDICYECSGYGDDYYIDDDDIESIVKSEKEYEQLIQHVGYTDEQLGRNK